MRVDPYDQGNKARGRRSVEGSVRAQNDSVSSVRRLHRGTPKGGNGMPVAQGRNARQPDKAWWKRSR